MSCIHREGGLGLPLQHGLPSEPRPRPSGCRALEAEPAGLPAGRRWGSGRLPRHSTPRLAGHSTPQLAPHSTPRLAPHSTPRLAGHVAPRQRAAALAPRCSGPRHSRGTGQGPPLTPRDTPPQHRDKRSPPRSPSPAGRAGARGSPSHLAHGAGPCVGHGAGAQNRPHPRSRAPGRLPRPRTGVSRGSPGDFPRGCWAGGAGRGWPGSVARPPVTALLSFVISPALLPAE